MSDRLLLALDASTTAIGWAIMDRDTVYECGTRTFASRSTFYIRLVTATYWLDNFRHSQCHPISAVALETPVIHRDPKKVNVETSLHLAYMDGALMATALRLGMNVYQVRPGERLIALGLPANLLRKDAKEMVRQRVNLLFGLELGPKEHDTGDAIAVGMAAIRQILQQEGSF